MNYLIALILCILATSKMSLQSAFGKKRVKNTADALCFNALIFLASAIVFSYEIIDCPWQVWIYATLAAFFAVIFQMTYTKALVIGNVSLTVLIVNMALVINVLVSYMFYNDSISKIRLLGILLTILTFFLCIDFQKRNIKNGKNWILFVITAMFCNAASSIIQKVLSKSTFADYNQEYTSASYFVAAILAYLMYRVQKLKGENKTFRIGKDAIIYSVLIGVILAIHVAVNVYALSVMEGTFLFPTTAGGTIILSTMTGVFFFKDKLNCKQILGIVIGIIAVVLMNF